MENVEQLQRQYVAFASSLYREGFLDDQFLRLQKLPDESNPDFVVEVISLYFEDSEKVLNNMASVLQQDVVDFKRVDAHVHQFKGSSSSVGAQRVKNCCAAFRNLCDEKNLEGPLRTFQYSKYLETLVGTGYGKGFDADVYIDKETNYANQYNNQNHTQLKNEYLLLKNKLETFIRLEQRILESGGNIPTPDVIKSLLEK